MAHVHESMTTLRIAGDDLISSEISQLLCCKPTGEQIKGQVFKNSRNGKERIAKTGMWRLDATMTLPEVIDRQILGILDKLNRDIAVWGQLSKKYEIDLSCGFFMEQTNEGVIVSSDSIRELGKRGIGLSIDIYAPLNDGA